MFSRRYCSKVSSQSEKIVAPTELSPGENPHRGRSFCLARDRSSLAVHVAQGAVTDLWIYDWQRGSRRPLTNGMVAQYTVWTS